MAEKQLLLRSKQEEVFRLVEKVGLNRVSFSFKEQLYRIFSITGRPEGEYVCSVLFHSDGHFFEFNYNGRSYNPEYSPGITATTEKKQNLPWKDILDLVNIWLSLVKEELGTPQPILQELKMNSNERWIKLEKIGNGGQGEVFHTVKKEYYVSSEFDRELIYGRGIPGKIDADKTAIGNINLTALKQLISRSIEFERKKDEFAIKYLFKPENDPNFDKAKTRLKDEIEAMAKNLHPNLMEIEDHDSDHLWYVMKFYAKGTLIKNSDYFKGKFLHSLLAFRPLVEAVAVLHKEKLVHRDIKPENIFLNEDQKLILGDFGLVHFDDPDKSRVSGTYENVGSRAWMPPWAYDVRLEDVKPSFDVYSLGKILYSMVTGKKILQLWYFEKENYNVEVLFPGVSSISLLNPFLKKCVVQFEEECLKNAGEMLKHLDQLIGGVTGNAEKVNRKMKMQCKVCGIRKYHMRVFDDQTEIRNYGLNPRGNRSYRIMACGYCGNIQLFLAEIGKDGAFKAWVQD